MPSVDPQILERINARAHSRANPLRQLTLTLSSAQKRALLFVGTSFVLVTGLILLSGQARPTTEHIAVEEQPALSQPSISHVVVDVQGAVVKPGIYELPLGSRVGDAIKAAGGVRKGSVTSSVNLARFLEDGEQVYVSGAEDLGGGSSDFPGGGGAIGKLNLNRATESELDGLPGVGPVLAKRIITHRSTSGNFSSIEDLQKVNGIGPAKFRELRDFVTV